MALAALVTDAVDAIYVLDPEGRFLYANPAACALTGYDADELEGSPFDDLVSEGDRERVRWTLGSALEQEVPLTDELDLRRKDGRTVSVEVRSTRLVWGGEVVGVHGIARDISARRARTRELEHKALHDPLTDLPNRALFRDRLEQAVLVERRKGVPFAVLVLDLDGFKEVNDELGHAVGDGLLAEVAGRLRGALRASDTVARLGGDEFAVLVDDCGASGARTVAGKLLRALDRPVTTGGTSAHVGASIGIGLCPDHGDDPDGLLERADAAMYTAKRTGHGMGIDGVTHVDFGRRARRRPTPGSGRLSGFLAGAAAALLLVAGVATPPLQRTPNSRVPAAPSVPSDGAVVEERTAERALEGWLSSASSGDLERIRTYAEPELEMTRVAFRADGVDDDRNVRPTGPLGRMPDGMRILERVPSEGAPEEGDPGPAREEDPAPGPPRGGEKEPSGEKPGRPPEAKRGGGEERPGRGRSVRAKRGRDDGSRSGRSREESARPRSPRRPRSSGGGSAEHRGRGNGAEGSGRGNGAEGSGRGNGGERRATGVERRSGDGGGRSRGNTTRGNGGSGTSRRGGERDDRPSNSTSPGGKKGGAQGKNSGKGNGGKGGGPPS